MPIDLDRIPKTKTQGFPAGVAEETFATRAEADAFVRGLHYPQDSDVEAGLVFVRYRAGDFEPRYVVRVRVGDFA